MKKIIMLITMFVLSVGFLMAQGVFNYQAVAVDVNGNLVPDQDVNAEVIIQSTGAPYVANFTGLHTSLNGMVVLTLGGPNEPDFQNIDWKNATIKVNFTADGINFPIYEAERVAGVPYALQAGGDDALTTKMIADYYGRATTTMDDMEAIFAALESNEPLANHMKQAFIDTVKNNRHVAKQILLHYLNTGTTDDVQALYNAFDGNSEVKAAVTQIVKQLIQTHREEVYAILRDYALHLTSAEVNDIFDAFPNDVKQEIVTRAANYVKDPAHKSTLIIPIFMNYVTNITVAEFNELVDALINNVPVYNVMLNQFNAWMDEYFAHHFTGGSNVEDLIAGVLEDGYYAQCTPNPVDLCQLKADIESLLPTACFVTNPSEPEFVNNLNDEKFEAEVAYSGSASIWQADAMYVSVNGGTEFELSPADYVTLSSGIINVEIPWSAFNNISGEDITSLEVQIDLFATCGDEEDTYSVTITWAE